MSEQTKAELKIAERLEGIEATLTEVFGVAYRTSGIARSLPSIEYQLQELKREAKAAAYRHVTEECTRHAEASGHWDAGTTAYYAIADWCEAQAKAQEQG